MSEQHIGPLDGLRGIAALTVVFTHGVNAKLWFLNAWDGISTIGVAIFFVLSGFLMGFLYLEKPYSSQAVLRYGISRFSRIAPAYLTIILISYFIFNVVDPSFVYAINNHNVLRHLLFSGNVSVFWSIPPEVQFYIFFIFIWYALHAYYANARLLPVMVILVVSLIMIIGRNHFPGTLLASKLHFFLFGCIAGAIRQKIKSIPISGYRLSVIQLTLFSLTILLGVYLVATYDYKYPYEIIYYALVTAVMIFLMSYQTSIANNIFANKPLSLIGKWSFSLYLTHEIVIQLAERAFKSGLLTQFYAAMFAIIGSIVLSWLMYEVVERPTQSLIKQKLTDRLLS